MLSERFESLFGGLVGAFITYDDTPRDPEHVVVLAAALAVLLGFFVFAAVLDLPERRFGFVVAVGDIKFV